MARMSLLRLGDQNCTQYSRCGLTKTLYNCSRTSLLLYSNPFAMNANIPFALISGLTPGILFQTVVNLIERREHETRENKRLLEKSQRIEAIMASMQATGAEELQLQEIEEMITAPEQQQLESLKHNVNMLDSSENQVDETIFILESYIATTRIEKEQPQKR
ncbi:DNA-directed RNA polymerase III subunit RPC3-like [Leucoraja erinacea]|uniref:DNA-directed RNA polymerase III subunit RPC3-like n=1 Tax=Leucoraja erinaceus TaxID=7782 RepID=UPI002455586A|nr:DNA-directed RNA polymerase III subunit RPC3-like [Leucoraja erinacea]